MSLRQPAVYKTAIGPLIINTWTAKFIVGLCVALCISPFLFAHPYMLIDEKWKWLGGIILVFLMPSKMDIRLISTRPEVSLNTDGLSILLKTQLSEHKLFIPWECVLQARIHRNFMAFFSPGIIIMCSPDGLEGDFNHCETIFPERHKELIFPWPLVRREDFRADVLYYAPKDNPLRRCIETF